MMELYLVVRYAVYDHGVFGVYSTEEKAKDAIEVAKSYEADGHHDFRIVKHFLDEGLSSERWGMSAYEED